MYASSLDMWPLHLPPYYRGEQCGSGIRVARPAQGPAGGRNGMMELDLPLTHLPYITANLLPLIQGDRADGAHIYSAFALLTPMVFRHKVSAVHLWCTLISPRRAQQSEDFVVCLIKIRPFVMGKKIKKRT